jgi:PAS domain S-box-containing protein
MEKSAIAGRSSFFAGIPRALQQALQTPISVSEWLPIGVCFCDRDGVLVQYNRRAAELWGRSPTPGDIRFRYCGAYRAYRSTGEPLPESEAPTNETLRTGRAVRDRDLVIERPDGSRITVLANADPLLDEDGEIVGAVNCFQDISEIKRTEERLSEQDQRLAATYENAAIAISEVDANGRLMRVNETVCAITGYSREELLKLTVFDVTHPDDRELDRDAYSSQASGDRNRYTVEKRLVCKDGRVIWVSIDSAAVRDSAGRFLYGIRVMQDITERKRVDEILRQSERRHRQLIEALPTAIYTTDAQGRMTYYNQAAVDLWGYRPELNSDRWCGSWRLYTPDGKPLPHDQCPMAVALKEDRPIRNAEAVAERPDGTRVPFIPYPTPLHDASGVLIGAVNMLVDITERKQAEARQKLLIEELNHRVKNTLATVQSLNLQTARQVTSFEEFCERMEGRLFALSKAHDQLSQCNWEHADLMKIVTAGLAPYQENDGTRITIKGEPIRLSPKAALTFAMICHELTTNAAKYGALSQPSGRLTIAWVSRECGSGRVLGFSWRESGGPQVTPPTRRGFGTILVERGIRLELGGAASLRFDPPGVSCEIETPLSIGAR